MPNPGELKSAIVTGASGTIGRAIIGVLLQNGMRVVAASRSISRLEKIVGQYHPDARDRVVLKETDVRIAEETRQLVEFTLETLGSVDVLVNAAGIYGAIGAVRDVAPIEWRHALETNLFGTYHCCYYALRRMVPSGKGRILNIAGGGATGPLEHLSSYAVSKAGVVRLTDTLAQEVGREGIHVNAILPGAVDSAMQDQLLLARDKAGPWYEKIKALRESGSGGISADLTAHLAKVLLFGAGRELNGKLLSARYDRFREWTSSEIELIARTDIFTLRRLDPATLTPLAENGLVLKL